MKNTLSATFTGHRELSEKKIEGIIAILNREIDKLIQEGVTDFISGVLGFDQNAATLVIAKKELGANIRLVFALPCRNQDEYWTIEQKRLYHSPLCVDDEVRYISEEYCSDCIIKAKLLYERPIRLLYMCLNLQQNWNR